MAYTNSPLVTYTRLTKNRTSPRSHIIDTITVHVWVGQVTAKQGCDYFATTDRQVSSNYVVGYDGSIGLSVEEKNRSWCSGGRDKNGNEIKVNGISGRDNDHRAVTIEVASDSKEPYAITDAAYNSLIKLIADICKRNKIKKLLWEGNKSLVGNIARQNMTVHRWFANKSCPGTYLYNKHSEIVKLVNKMLEADSVTASPKPVESTSDFRVGDTVNFTGTKHYTSSNGVNGKTCKPGKAKITALSTTGKYRVHIVAVKGGSSNVYGWVDATLITRENANLAVGARVKVNEGAKTYTGGTLKPFVYKTVYDVISMSGNRVVIGIGKAVTAAVHKKDLTVV